MNGVRAVVRWLLTALLVSLPVSYLFWHGKTDGDPLFRNFSYDGFRAAYLEGAAPTYRTFALWTLLVVIGLNLATALVAGLLGKIFPARVVRVEDLKRK